MEPFERRFSSYQEKVVAGSTWETFVTQHRRRGIVVIHVCCRKRECYLIDCLFPQRKDFHPIQQSGWETDRTEALLQHMPCAWLIILTRVHFPQISTRPTMLFIPAIGLKTLDRLTGLLWPMLSEDHSVPFLSTIQLVPKIYINCRILMSAVGTWCSWWI